MCKQITHYCVECTFTEGYTKCGGIPEQSPTFIELLPWGQALFKALAGISLFNSHNNPVR